jgi:hypothetical protein
MLEIKLPVSILKEGKKYIAYTPALDLSTSGKSQSEVKKRFSEIVNIFFEELIEKDTLEESLKDLGWEKAGKSWNAPQIISQKSETFCVPA